MQIWCDFQLFIFLCILLFFISYYIYGFISNVFFCSGIHPSYFEKHIKAIWYQFISSHICLYMNICNFSTFLWHAHTNCYVTPYRYIRFLRKWYQNVHKTWGKKVMKQQFKRLRRNLRKCRGGGGGLPGPPPPPPSTVKVKAKYFSYALWHHIINPK